MCIYPVHLSCAFTCLKAKLILMSFLPSSLPVGYFEIFEQFSLCSVSGSLLPFRAITEEACPSGLLICGCEIQISKRVGLFKQKCRPTVEQFGLDNASTWIAANMFYHICYFLQENAMESGFSRQKAKKKLQLIAAALKSAQSGLCHTVLAPGQISHTLAYLSLVKSWHILELHTNSFKQLGKKHKFWCKWAAPPGIWDCISLHANYGVYSFVMNLI